MFGISSKEEFIKLSPSELSPPNQLDGKNSLNHQMKKPVLHIGKALTALIGFIAVPMAKIFLPKCFYRFLI